MNCSTVPRVIALVVLLLHGGGYAAATVIDGAVAARANAVVSHVEADGGAACVLSHDEATCQLCRIGATSGWIVSAHVPTVAVKRGTKPAAGAQDSQAAIARSALYSRAPPIA